MALYPGEKRFVSEINVTSLVDVTMVLLIIFILVAPMMESGFTVDLPEAQQPELEVESAAVITIDAGGVVYLGNKRVTLSELKERLSKLSESNPAASAVVKADGSLQYRRVVEVLDVVEQSGIAELGIATRAGEQE